MPRPSLAIILFFAVLASGSLAYFFLRQQNQHHIKNATQPRVQVAQATELVGIASLRKAFTNQIIPLEQVQLPYPIYHQDRISVMSGSLVQLVTNSGAQVILTENSESFIEYFKPNDMLSPVYIFVRKGEIEIKNAGADRRLFIVKNRKIFAPAELALEKNQPTPKIIIQNTLSPSHEAQAPSNAPTEEDSQSDNRKEKPVVSAIVKFDNEETLSNEYIEARLASQYQTFRKCQINSLRDRESAVGRMTFSLQVEPNGTISHAKVISSEAQAPLLEKCVKEVLLRTVFKSFKGKSFTISYPIEFQ